jgi:hypothetical protein
MMLGLELFVPYKLQLSKPAPASAEIPLEASDVVKGETHGLFEEHITRIA